MAQRIEYDDHAPSIFKAPIMSIADEGHGLVGVCYEADTKQAHSWDEKTKKPGPPKWFRGRKMVITDDPQPNDRPVLDYVYHFAVEQGKGAFVERDEDSGEAVKTASGKNKKVVRTVTEEDVVIILGGKYGSELARELKINPGTKARIKRTSPAKDENGDNLTFIDYDAAVLGTVDNPRPYKTESLDYEDSGDDFTSDSSSEAELVESAF